jgi:hypothetical protein
MSAFEKGKRYENCNRTRIKAGIKIKINEPTAQTMILKGRFYE